MNILIEKRKRITIVNSTSETTYTVLYTLTKLQDFLRDLALPWGLDAWKCSSKIIHNSMCCTWIYAYATSFKAVQSRIKIAFRPDKLNKNLTINGNEDYYH